jgi:hypothetical protein
VPGANFTVTFGTVRGRNPGAGSKVHISRIAVASILLFGRVDLAWSEEQIGGAHTVINHVEGNLASGNQVPVIQGDNVFLNEAVQSSADSKANLVLNDNTNVTVGPSSTVKLDEFVYSGPKQRGTIALNMTKGTLRFITGDANKRAYTIFTPTAAIGVRGTILRIQVTPTETKVINEEGVAIVCHRNGNASVEELRKRRCSKAQRANGSCGCEELLVPNQQATVSQSQIAVTEAPVGAISDPIIAEGFTGGFAAGGLVAPAALVGAGIAAVAVVGATTTTSGPSPALFSSPVSPLSP